MENLVAYMSLETGQTEKLEANSLCGKAPLAAVIIMTNLFI